MYMLQHPFTQKSFIPSIHHGTGLLVENYPKHPIITHGGNLGTSGLILGSSSSTRKQGNGTETTPPIVNATQPMNYGKLGPIFKPRGKGGNEKGTGMLSKRKNIQLVI